MAVVLVENVLIMWNSAARHRGLPSDGSSELADVPHAENVVNISASTAAIRQKSGFIGQLSAAAVSGNLLPFVQRTTYFQLLV